MKKWTKEELAELAALEPKDGAFAAGDYARIERLSAELGADAPFDPYEDARVRRALANFMRCAAECKEVLPDGFFEGPVVQRIPIEQPSSVWDAFREAGMAKIANAALKEHGWMLVFDLSGDTVPMKLPGEARIKSVDELDTDDMRQLARLAKMEVA